MMWDGWGGGHGMGGFALWHLLWWLLLIAGAAALIRLILRPRSDKDHALRILRERYARGEIDKAEFDARMRDLN